MAAWEASSLVPPLCDMWRVEGVLAVGLSSCLSCVLAVGQFSVMGLQVAVILRGERPCVLQHFTVSLD